MERVASSGVAKAGPADEVKDDFEVTDEETVEEDSEEVFGVEVDLSVDEGLSNPKTPEKLEEDESGAPKTNDGDDLEEVEEDPKLNSGVALNSNFTGAEGVKDTVEPDLDSFEDEEEEEDDDCDAAGETPKTVAVVLT